MAPGKENLCEVSSEQVLCFFFSFSFLFYLDIYLLIRLLICVKTRTVDIWQIYYLSPTRSTLRGIMIVNDDVIRKRTSQPSPNNSKNKR